MALIKDQVSIKEKFYGYALHKQVAIYAEAVQEEKYELLHVLKNLIRPTDKPVFLKMVDDYTIGKYGKS
jgi:hypothetical protein